MTHAGAYLTHRAGGLVVSTCTGELARTWSRSERVYEAGGGGGVWGEHTVERWACAACGAAVVLDRTAARVANDYLPPPAPQRLRALASADDRDDEGAR